MAAHVKTVGFLFVGFSCMQLLGAQQVAELEIRLDPKVMALRPLESVVVQVRAYGYVQDEDGEQVRVRVAPGGVDFRLVDEGGGWLSKPFRYQAEEDEKFYEAQSASLTDLWIGRATGVFLRQDSVLYTAPGKPGDFVVEARAGGRNVEARMTVDHRAESVRRVEAKSFPPEPPDLSRHRTLAEHHAPFIAQATWFDPKADFLARFDFDGDWKGDNNWDSTPEGSSQAYVHYAVMETGTHWFLIYSFFHPRDYSENCVPGMCHENDNEGVILTVRKDGSRFGSLQVLESLAHDNVYSYRNDQRLKKRAHGFDGKVEFYEGTHPVVFVESGGHGVYGVTDRHSKYDLSRDAFTDGTGVTYVYKGIAERPLHPNDRQVGYQLLPIYEHWWLRAHPRGAVSGQPTDPVEIREDTFAEYFDYQPEGKRPDTVLDQVAGSFLGRRYGSNKAKPFWGWHDRKTSKKKISAPGQWGLDPAYAVSNHFKFPKPFSLDYVFNAFLNVPNGAIGRPGGWPDGARRGPRPGDLGTGSGSFTARPSPDSSGESRRGRFDLRLRVDATLEIWVQGNQVHYRVLGGGMPNDMGSVYSRELPMSDVSNFEVRRVKGRGKVVLLERPGASNGFTARLRIEDPKSGSGFYHVLLTWRF